MRHRELGLMRACRGRGREVFSPGPAACWHIGNYFVGRPRRLCGRRNLLGHLSPAGRAFLVRREYVARLALLNLRSGVGSIALHRGRKEVLAEVVTALCVGRTLVSG